MTGTVCVAQITKQTASQSSKTKSTSTSQSTSKNKLPPAPSTVKGAAPHINLTQPQAVKSLSPHRVATKKISKEEEKPTTGFGGQARLLKNNSLINHQDSTYADGMGYAVDLTYRFNSSSVTGKLSYDQNLRSNYEGDSDFNDLSLTYALSPKTLTELAENKLSFVPSVTMLVPLSRKSTKYDQLQTAIILGAGLGLAPKKPSLNGDFSYSLGVTLGRNIHRYQEDANGKVLGQYSSSQSLGIAYALKGFSLSLSFANKIRWSYANKTSQAFELTEELGYNFNKTFSVALGHTNSGAALKANGQDSNIALTNEEDSVIYIYGAVNF